MGIDYFIISGSIEERLKIYTQKKADIIDAELTVALEGSRVSVVAFWLTMAMMTAASFEEDVIRNRFVVQDFEQRWLLCRGLNALDERGTSRKWMY